MAIQLIDNFELSVTKPIDNRIVVGPGLTYTTKEGIPLPYAGMRIYDLNDNTAWVYKGTSWSADVEKMSIQNGGQFATQSYLTFVSALSGINLVYSFANFRINPANGQLIGPTGTNANPTYGFTTSSATSFMGMWKSANDSLAFSIAGTKYFEIGTTGITASNSLRISNTSGSTNTVGGGSLILNAGTNKNFEFYSLSNDSLFRIYNSSSARILPGESTTATDRTLELQNETSRSIMKVRDYHRIRTHSGTGVISLGDGTNDDFVFYMNGWTLSGPTNLSATFSQPNGGLNIKNNLRVGKSMVLMGSMIHGSSVFSTDVDSFYHKIDSSSAWQFLKTAVPGKSSFYINSASGGISKTFEISVDSSIPATPYVDFNFPSGSTFRLSTLSQAIFSGKILVNTIKAAIPTSGSNIVTFEDSSVVANNFYGKVIQTNVQQLTSIKLQVLGTGDVTPVWGLVIGAGTTVNYNPQLNINYNNFDYISIERRNSPVLDSNRVRFTDGQTIFKLQIVAKTWDRYIIWYNKGWTNTYKDVLVNIYQDNGGVETLVYSIIHGALGGGQFLLAANTTINIEMVSHRGIHKNSGLLNGDRFTNYDVENPSNNGRVAILFAFREIKIASTITGTVPRIPPAYQNGGEIVIAGVT